ncbi:transglutaminase family protein [Achromobacter sp. GG226]|uniref:transglutaminase-like domain-containing protein n=1 Tax=Verticiella alkaliphila TaxID=2779529 RepID=UPI001C0E3D88|nr:transglutaminase family protein [Verticiella sp. GG226]MBU4610781.1 transglutaminase family protein [Verticiella sp. GG226]
MPRLHYTVSLAYEVQDAAARVILNIEAARTAHQAIVRESLTLPPGVQVDRHTDPVLANRWLRVHAPPGPLTIQYEAVVDVNAHEADPLTLSEPFVGDLPFEVLPYLAPSRYAESDRLRASAWREFGALAPGYGRVMAVRAWVQQHLQYVSQSSVETTSATDSIITRVGVCRDFANLMAALCRALNLPARFTTSLDYGKDPALGPSDFHAVVEVFLSGRWYLFDPSGVALPTGLLRIGTGRDASDIPFASLFGAVVPVAPPAITVVALAEDGHAWPAATSLALSTA